MGVETQHTDFVKNAAKWQRCRDVHSGSDAIKAQGETYLAKLDSQDATEYQAYLDRALFYNATSRTVEGLLGMIFRKELAVEVPGIIEDRIYDITGTGVPLDLFAKSATREVLIVGRYGIMVDMPEEPSTDAKPYLTGYKAEQIVNWRVGLVNGDRVLTRVVLSETEIVEDPEDEFGVKEVQRYRVLNLIDGVYVIKIYQLADEKKADSWVKAKEIIPQVRGSALDYIPFVFLGPNTITPDVDKPPILDLVEVNLSHFRSSADLEHGRHFTALPTVWVSGFDADTELKVGSTTAWVTRNTDAKCGMLEFTGQGLAALEKAVAEKEEKMAALGARMLEKQKSGTEAAETVKIRQAGEQSTLQSLAVTMSLGFTLAMRWLTEWSAAAGDVSVKLNTEFFEASMDSGKLKDLVAIWQGGGISKPTLYFNLQKGGIARPGVDFEKEQSDIQAGGVL